MSILRKVFDFLLFVPPVSNPDEARRRRLLSSVLTLVALIFALSLWTTFSDYSARQVWSGQALADILQYPEAARLLLCQVIAATAALAAWLLNRLRVPGWLPAALFEGAITLSLAFSDTSRQLVDGRSLITWVFPIALAPLILPAWSTFLVMGLITLLLSALFATLGWYPNLYTLLTLAAIAFLSWLAARALEKALGTARREAEKNRVILNGVADGIVVLDEAGQVVSANPAALSVLDGEMDSLLKQAGERVEHAGRVLSFSWAEVAGIGRVAVVRDETRRAEIERAKEALLATVSHELRTPLNAILGYAEIISLQAKDLPAVAEMAGRIKANTGRLNSLVESLLDRAMLEAGAIQVHKTAFHPTELFRQVEGLMSGLAAEQRVKLVFTLDPALPDELCGDPQRLSQVLVNLISNGIKFTDSGGMVSVHLWMERPDWLLEVADTGIGIPPERLPDIFEPFRRGSDFATRRHQGAGLGLSIVRSLVELMGGSIKVQSTVGRGTTFSLRFPLEVSA